LRERTEIQMLRAERGQGQRTGDWTAGCEERERQTKPAHAATKKRREHSLSLSIYHIHIFTFLKNCFHNNKKLLFQGSAFHFKIYTEIFFTNI